MALPPPGNRNPSPLDGPDKIAAVQQPNENRLDHRAKTIISRSRILFISTAFSCCLAACSSKAPKVATYQTNGVQFSYYSDWKIAKDAPVEGKPDVRSILLKGPNHAVVTLVCVPPSSQQTLEQYARTVADIRKTKIEDRLKAAEVDKGSSEPVTGKVAGSEQTGIHQQFSIELLNQAVPHDVNFFMLRGSQYKVMIMSQVPQKHSESSRPGIDLIFSSLRIEGLP
jgi:hypothetical protein